MRRDFFCARASGLTDNETDREGTTTMYCPATPTSTVFPIVDDYSPSPYTRNQATPTPTLTGFSIADTHSPIPRSGNGARATVTTQSQLRDRLRSVLGNLADRDAALRDADLFHSDADESNISCLLAPGAQIRPPDSRRKRQSHRKLKYEGSSIRSSPSVTTSRSFDKYRDFLRPSSALDHAAAVSAQATVVYATCTRCGSGFKRYIQDDEEVIVYSTEDCVYHPGYISEWISNPTTLVDPFWSCCDQDLDALGCCAWDTHRCDGDPADSVPVFGDTFDFFNEL